MGKRKKRMIMTKYAKKYALQRKTLGFEKEEDPMIVLDSSGQEEKQEENVIVVSNKEPKQEKEAAPPWDLEPQLVQIEEPQVEELPEVVAPKPARKRTTRNAQQKKLLPQLARDTTTKTKD